MALIVICCQSCACASGLPSGSGPAVLADGSGSLLAGCMQAQAAVQVLEGERGAAAVREKEWNAERDQLQAGLKAAQQARDTVRACMAQYGDS
jgi:hypothetical protein